MVDYGFRAVRTSLHVNGPGGHGKSRQVGVIPRRLAHHQSRSAFKRAMYNRMGEE